MIGQELVGTLKVIAQQPLKRIRALHLANTPSSIRLDRLTGVLMISISEYIGRK